MTQIFSEKKIERITEFEPYYQKYSLFSEIIIIGKSPYGRDSVYFEEINKGITTGTKCVIMDIDNKKVADWQSIMSNCQVVFQGMTEDYEMEFLCLIKSVSTLLGRIINLRKGDIIDRGKPHDLEHLPKNKMVVYTFIYENQFLKIGKVGVHGDNRFFYQHYHPGSAGSTLSDSILLDSDMKDFGITSDKVGDWIKKDNCRRIDILLDANLGSFVLEIVEAILHYKYEPRYEG